MSPDGAWILYQDARSDSASIMRFPIQGGPSVKVMPVQVGADFQVTLPPSALCVVSELQGSETVFFSFDPVRGRGPEIARLEAVASTSWCLAPDGSALAVLDVRSPQPRIVVVSLSGAPRHDVALNFAGAKGIQHLAWDRSGLGWLAVVYWGKSWNLLHIDGNGDAVELLPPQVWMYSSAMSPDGRRVVFTSNTVEANAWLLEHF
jgi:hypothetical protein